MSVRDIRACHIEIDILKADNTQLRAEVEALRREVSLTNGFREMAHGQKVKLENDCANLKQTNDQLAEALAAVTRERDEAVEALRWVQQHSSMGLVRGGTGPAVGFLDDICRRAREIVEGKR